MKHLTKEQRYQIKAYLKCGKSVPFIANALNVHKTTIYRELKRNARKRGSYDPNYAHQLANERKERFAFNRKFTFTMKKRVIRYLVEEQWSPEQIVGYCKKNNIPMVSTERIYQFIRMDKNNGGDLYKYLRHKLKHRKRPVNGNKSPIKNRTSIDLRPQEVNERKTFGHFEADLMIGAKQKGAILVLVERITGYSFIKYLPHGKNAKHVAKTIIKLLSPIKDYVQSITFDNGSEFSEHQLVAKKLKLKTYFTHPYSSWEKGQVENTNKLIRQYIPKKMEINQHTTRNLKQIHRKINTRPRKKYDYENPDHLFTMFVKQKVAFGG